MAWAQATLHPMACPRLVSFGGNVRLRLRPIFTRVHVRAESSSSSNAAGVDSVGSAAPGAAEETRSSSLEPIFPQGISAAEGGFFNRRSLPNGSTPTPEKTFAQRGKSGRTLETDSRQGNGRGTYGGPGKESKKDEAQGWWAEAVATIGPPVASASEQRSFTKPQRAVPAYEVKRQVSTSPAPPFRSVGSRSISSRPSIPAKFSKYTSTEAARFPTYSSGSDRKSQASRSTDIEPSRFPPESSGGRSPPTSRSRPPPASQLFQGRAVPPPPSRPLPIPPWERKLRKTQQKDDAPEPAWVDEDAAPKVPGRTPLGSRSPPYGDDRAPARTGRSRGDEQPGGDRWRQPAGNRAPASTRSRRGEEAPSGRPTPGWTAPPGAPRGKGSETRQWRGGRREAPAGAWRLGKEAADEDFTGDDEMGLEEACETGEGWEGGEGERGGPSELELEDGFLSDWYGRGEPAIMQVRNEGAEDAELSEGPQAAESPGPASYDSWSMGVQPAWRDQEGVTGTKTKIKPRKEGEEEVSMPWKFNGLYEGPDGKLYREPYHDPFGPESHPRPWTGKRPIVRKKKPDEFDSFNPPPRKKGMKPVTKPGPFLEGAGPETRRDKTDIMGEPLTREEIDELVTKARKQTKHVSIGRDGLVHNLVEVIHTHWKRNLVARIKCKGVPTIDMPGLSREIEEKTGGKIIEAQGGVMFLFRGRFYNYKTRPKYQTMLWKPPTPLFPPVVPDSPGGLSNEDVDRYVRVGKALRPLCTLNKNGVYMNLVANVREGFAASVLVRIDMTPLERGDYTKLTARLKDMVPCIPLSLKGGNVILWRGPEGLVADGAAGQVEEAESAQSVAVEEKSEEEGDGEGEAQSVSKEENSVGEAVGESSEVKGNVGEL